RWGTSGSAPGELFFPTGIDVDKAGNLYVTDSGNQRVQLFKPDGAFVEAFGGAGAGDGQLNNPADVALDPSGRVFVMDKDNSRVQRFSPSTTPARAATWSGLRRRYRR